MALLEQETIRFAEALDDYENVSVSDMGGWGPMGFWLVVRDERFDISYEIASHCDYWDVVSSLLRSSLHSAANSRRRERQDPWWRMLPLLECECYGSAFGLQSWPQWDPTS